MTITSSVLRVARSYGRLQRRKGKHGQDQADRFSSLRTRFYREFWDQAASAVGAEIRRFDGGWAKISRGSQWTWVQVDKIAIDDHLRVRASRNKPLIAELLASHGYRAPRSLTFVMEDIKAALTFAKSIDGPVVVKPSDGTGAGRGVTTGLRTRAQIARASLWASSFHPEVLMEEQVAGASYRLLYIDGVFADAVRRDPPHVVGDGKHSLSDLVERENRRRLEEDPIASLSPIAIDLEFKNFQSAAGRSASYVPGAGQRVQLKEVCNQNRADENHIVRDAFHPSIIDACNRLVAEIGLALAGVDLMCTDPAVELAASDVTINEINSTPGLHHHVLVHEKNQRAPIGEKVLELALGG